MLGLLGLDARGRAWLLVVVAVLDALLGMALGLFAARSRGPSSRRCSSCRPFVFPQLLLCGLFVARDEMPPCCSAVSDVLPLSYAVDAMNQVDGRRNFSRDLAVDLLVVGGFVVAALGLGAATLRRRTA